jgi:hypothetical protein
MDIMQLSMIALPGLLGCAGIAFLISVFFPSRLALRVSLLASSATLVFLLCYVWFFRDGLGPDATTSRGLEAARGIAPEAGFLVLCWLLVNGSTYLAYRANRVGL